MHYTHAVFQRVEHTILSASPGSMIPLAAEPTDIESTPLGATVELSKSRRSHQGAAPMKRSANYVALDVHQTTTVASVREQSGRVIAGCILPTERAASRAASLAVARTYSASVMAKIRCGPLHTQGAKWFKSVGASRKAGVMWRTRRRRPSAKGFPLRSATASAVSEPSRGHWGERLRNCAEALATPFAVISEIKGDRRKVGSGKRTRMVEMLRGHSCANSAQDQNARHYQPG